MYEKSTVRVLPALIAALPLFAALALTGGCGQSAEEQLWDEALTFYGPTKHMLASPEDQDAESQRLLYENVVRSVDRALERHPDADERLRRVLVDIRDHAEQIAAQPTGAEADEHRQRHEALWSYLERRELPPDYR